MPRKARTAPAKDNPARRGRAPARVQPLLARRRPPAERRAELEARLRAKGIKPMDEATLDAMSDVWPEEESLDEFLAWLYQSRREGRAR